MGFRGRCIVIHIQYTSYGRRFQAKLRHRYVQISAPILGKLLVYVPTPTGRAGERSPILTAVI